MIHCIDTIFGMRGELVLGCLPNMWYRMLNTFLSRI